MEATRISNSDSVAISTPTPCALPVRFRAPVPDDLNVIRSSWVKSARKAPAHVAVPGDRYFASYPAIVEALLRRARVAIACNPEAEQQVFAWVCYEPWPAGLVLHYVYAKFHFRRLGVARALLAAIWPAFGHEETVCTSMCGSLSPGVRWGELARRFKLSYDPYRVLEVKA